ncbi:OsmC family protein [Chryseolinea sp. T2]|uniref:OsmC family protein n=1 Tax=Chryseolinea sp. T2 TaxID=3129255 RepID=UPI0030777766
MKIITRMIGEDLFESSTEAGNLVRIDMRKASEKTGQSPVEILQSALAACAGVEVAGMMKKRRRTVEGLRVEVTCVRNEETPRWLKEIHCKYILTSPDATSDEVEKVTKLALEKYCSVASSLKSVITFSVEIER